MKLNPFLLTCTILLGALSFSPSSSALAIRCNSFVVDVGMHKAEVMQKCGMPGSQERRIERRIVRAPQGGSRHVAHRAAHQQNHDHRGAQAVEIEREIEIVREEWIYNFGPHQFMQLLVFEDGRLKEIQNLGYGN